MKERGTIKRNIRVDVDMQDFIENVLYEYVASAIAKSDSQIDEVEFDDWDMDGENIVLYGKYETGCTITTHPATLEEPEEYDVDCDCEYIDNEKVQENFDLHLLKDKSKITVYVQD